MVCGDDDWACCAHLHHQFLSGDWAMLLHPMPGCVVDTLALVCHHCFLLASCSLCYYACPNRCGTSLCSRGRHMLVWPVIVVSGAIVVPSYYPLSVACSARMAKSGPCMFTLMHAAQEECQGLLAGWAATAPAAPVRCTMWKCMGTNKNTYHPSHHPQVSCLRPKRFYGVMVSTLDSESSDPSSNLGRT